MNDLSRDIQRLADSGIAAYPPAKLRDLADRSAEAGESLDRAWPFVLEQAIDRLAAAWEALDEESGEGVPKILVDRLDEVQSPLLRRLHDATSDRDRLAAAADLRNAVTEALFSDLKR